MLRTLPCPRNLSWGALCLGILAPLASLAQDGPSPADVRLAFDGSVVIVQGKRLPLPAEQADFVRLLGKPDREAALANTIATWDRLGILTYRAPNTTKVFNVVVCFGAEKFKFWPQRAFSGSFQLDGVPVTVSTPIADVNRERKGAALEFDRILQRWRYASGKHFVHWFDREEEINGRSQVRLISLSMEVPKAPGKSIDN